MSGPVGPRVPKDEFMRALGLDHNNPHHEGYYRAMRDEAIAVYNRINQDRTNLIDERRGDAGTRPPFFWHHIRPDRRRQAIMETWQRAQTGTIPRRLFDYGATNGEHAPNWVTLWLLYSVFRSRDFRNNRNRRNGDDKGNGGGGESTNAYPTDEMQADQSYEQDTAQVVRLRTIVTTIQQEMVTSDGDTGIMSFEIV